METSLPEYFRKQLNHYAENLNPRPHEDTLWYVGEMMVRFSRSDHFLDYYQGRLQNRPLALLYGDAQAARNHHERCQLLQRLGDMALFIGALFPERHARFGIKADYFVGMGSAAYDYLAEQAQRNRHIYRELTEGFSRMLELVARAAHRKQKSSHEQLMQLYAAWLESGDPLLARRLQAQGVVLEKHRHH